MKISLLVADFSDNCVGRAYILAKVLMRRYEVEVVGPVFGSGIWPPADTGEIHYKPVAAAGRSYLSQVLPQILEAIDGQVIYALKPLNTSFGAALIAKLRGRLPLVLDIDDWEVGGVKWNIKHDFRSVAAQWRHPNWPIWTLWLDTLVSLADKITVSNHFLANRYGGHLIPHGQDTTFLDPEKYDSLAIKQTLGFAGKRIILFLGTPRLHKGIDILIEAAKSLHDPHVMVLLVGVNFDDPLVQSLKAQRHDFLHFFGMISLQERPKWLAIADLIVLPQPDSPVSAGQIPAKLFDAMAMAKPIIATNVSDTATILEDCGFIVPPADQERLTDTIKFVLAHPDESAAKGRAARQKCINLYSWNKIEESLAEVFAEYE